MDSPQASGTLLAGEVASRPDSRKAKLPPRKQVTLASQEDLTASQARKEARLTGAVLFAAGRCGCVSEPSIAIASVMACCRWSPIDSVADEPTGPAGRQREARHVWVKPAIPALPWPHQLQACLVDLWVFSIKG